MLKIIGDTTWLSRDRSSVEEGEVMRREGRSGGEKFFYTGNDLGRCHGRNSIIMHQCYNTTDFLGHKQTQGT